MPYFEMTLMSQPPGSPTPNGAHCPIAIGIWRTPYFTHTQTHLNNIVAHLNMLSRLIEKMPKLETRSRDSSRTRVQLEGDDNANLSLCVTSEQLFLKNSRTNTVISTTIMIRDTHVKNAQIHPRHLHLFVPNPLWH